MQISSDDQYTKLICKDCTTELLMVAKFRWKCKTSEGTLTQLTDAMEPNDLHKLNVTDAKDDCTSLPNDTSDDKAGLSKDETDSNLELSKPASFTEEIISPLTDDISETSANEYNDVEDGESEAVLLKREVYEEIEYLQFGKNVGQQPAKGQLHYVIDATGNSEAVQYILMQSPSHHDDDCFNDVIEDVQEGNDVRDQTDVENDISQSGKEVNPKILSKFLIYYSVSILCFYWMQQYEIIISDVVDYESDVVDNDGDGVSNEAVLPNDDDYFDIDGKLIIEQGKKRDVNTK